MVAYTTPDCLPYFECDDSACLNTGTVCEPSTVFCDLVNLLDTRLTGFDDIIGRTATAIPFAKVARAGVTQDLDLNVIGFDSRVIWNTVLEDNNNMVDLEVNPKVVSIPTPGIYILESRISGIPPQTVSNILNHYITPGSTGGSILTQSDSLWRSGTNYSTLVTQRYVSASDIANSGSDAGYPVSVNVEFQGTIGTGIVKVFYAEMTVYWVADAP